MKCIIKRRVCFSASHRYWLPELSEAENRQKFGRGSVFPGHGHNYVLFVSMQGDIQPNGMVISLADAKAVIRREITDDLDEAYLNQAWPEFEQTLPTTEFLAQVIWRRLAPYLPLAEVQLYEHPQLWASCTGDNMQSTLTIGTHFSAAHRLALNELSDTENHELYGKCARPHGHGHNYHLEVTVQGEIDPRTGMIVELTALQKAIEDAVIEPFDHTFLNLDIPYFATVIPTAENIAVYIANILQEPLRALDVQLHRVKLIESPNNSCEILCAPVAPVQASQAAKASVLV